VECFCRFLSGGNESDERGRAIGGQMGANPFADDFLHGEKFKKTAELTAQFVDAFPMRQIPARYAVVKPLDQVGGEETPRNVTFFVDPDQLSALVILANFRDPLGERTIVPWAAGCQVMGALAYREAERERPRGLVGLTDLSARLNTRATLGPNILSFTAPWALFQQMEEDAGDCFLQRETWLALRRKPTPA
jgi:hypothetical protein